MALGYSTAHRAARLQAISDYAGAGALLRLYSGTRPATGGTATTLLAELVCGNPFGTVSGVALTVSGITNDSSADASGTVTWFRIVKADGTTHVMDGTVGTSGQDLNFSGGTTVAAGQVVSVSSITITEGAA